MLFLQKFGKIVLHALCGVNMPRKAHTLHQWIDDWNLQHNSSICTANITLCSSSNMPAIKKLLMERTKCCDYSRNLATYN